MSRMMTFLAEVPLIDSADTVRYYAFMRNKRAHNLRGSVTDPVWQSPKLQAWPSAQSSSLSVIKGTLQSRFEVKDFCISVIEQLQDARVPVLWALKTTGGKKGLQKQTATAIQSASRIDILKHLILQALRLNPILRTEKSMPLSCARLQSSATEEEWFQLLEGVLAGVPNEVCVLID